jgi:hypothetical protein
LTTQGLIYDFTNNKMKPVRKESAQPYCTRVSISGWPRVLGGHNITFVC